jgi:hypothetical protein
VTEVRSKQIIGKFAMHQVDIIRRYVPDFPCEGALASNDVRCSSAVDYRDMHRSVTRVETFIEKGAGPLASGRPLNECYLRDPFERRSEILRAF